MDDIPKIFFCYWDGSKLSFLQYLTLRTFRDLHPDWKIVMYMPITKFSNKISWKTHEQKKEYIGKDYFHKVAECDVEIRKIDMSEIGFRNDIHEVYKSDCLRYYLLWKFGGLWSDMDVIFIRAIDNTILQYGKLLGNKVKINTILCTIKKKHPIGLFISQSGNPLFKNLFDNCNKFLDLDEYQSIGFRMIQQIYGTTENMIVKHPDCGVVEFDRYLYLSYPPKKIGYFFNQSDMSYIKPYTIGIHWYNGADAAKDFQNSFSDEKHTKHRDGLIYKYISKYI